MGFLVCGRIRSICLVIAFLLINIGITLAVPAATAVTNPIHCVLCRILTILWGVTAGIATFVIVIAGIKWMGSMDDPGARAQAKSSIVHAVIGLIIVMIALQLVGWAVTNTVAEFDPLDFIPVAAGGNGCVPFCT